MIKIGKWSFAIIVLLYIIACTYLYVQQESMLFHPTKLPSDYQYDFEENFVEKTITVEGGTQLNGVLFKADNSKGLIFYLHGNSGSLSSWGSVAKTYTEINYDCFILDYRGYGKSEGEIYSEDQFYSDVEIAYDSLKAFYKEENIIILGYSIGTGSAAMLASRSNAKHLILLAPYYSITDMMNHIYPIVPGFLLEYKFSTFEYIPKIKPPISIFHGDADEVIYYESSLKLKEHFGVKDQLITLPNQKHHGMNENPIYQEWLNKMF